MISHGARSYPTVDAVFAAVLIVLLVPAFLRAQTTDLIETSSSSVDFGNVFLGSTRSADVKINNISSVRIYVSSIAISDEGSDFSADNDGGFYLSAEESVVLGVSFSPKTSGAQRAAVQIEAQVVVIGKQEPAGEEGDAKRADGAVPVETETVVLTGTGVSPADIIVSPTELDFGDVRVGRSERRILTISNPGETTLIVYEAVVAQGGDFSVSSADSFTVSPGQEEALAVRFVPNDEGRKAGLLTITSNDPEQPEVEVALIGRGVTPEIAVSPSRLDFREIPLGKSDTLYLTVVNEGQFDLAVEGIRLSGSDDFSVENGEPFMLGVNGEAEVAVVFSPIRRGPQEATLHIESDDPRRPEVQIALEGTGTAAAVVVSSDTLGFGRTLVGWQRTLSLRVTNGGTADLHFTEIGVAGTNSEDFQLGAVPTRVSPREQGTIDVIFQPMTAGHKEAILQIQSNDPSANRVEVSIGGQGVEAENRSSDTADEQSAAEVSVRLPEDVSSPPSGRIYFRRTGQQTYQSRALQSEGNLFTAKLPGDYVTARGVQYYFEFTDGQQTVTFPVEDPQSRPLQLQVRVREMTPSFEMAPSVYRMISIPLQLEVPSLRRVMMDDYDSYDPRNWRLFRWQDGGYIEFPALESALEPGKAFWLITRDGKAFDVENGQSVDASTPFAIELQPGWNQMGNPFAFPVAWEQVQYDGEIDPPVYYDGAELRYDQNALILQPWEGYFVYNSEEVPVTLEIPPVEASVPNADSRDERLAEVMAGEKGYVLQLSARIPEGPWKDTQNWLGYFDREVSGSIDPVRVEAPGPAANVRLSILRDGVRYAAIVRKPDRRGTRWDLELSRQNIPGGSKGGDEVQIQLQEYGVRREGFQIYMFDRDRGKIRSIEDGVLSFAWPDESSTKRFSLVLGTPSFAEDQRDSLLAVPDTYVLEQNYPNPFNPTTMIGYRLPRRSKVVLEVYDVLGRRVRRLVDTVQGPGRYEVLWNGRDASGRPLSSGIYLYRITAESFTATHKALLLR